MHDPAMISYMCKKYQWSQEVFSLIKSEAYANDVYKQPIMYMVGNMKMIHRWQTINKKRKLYCKNGGDMDKCKECG